VDVCARFLDAALDLDSPPLRVANTPEGAERLAAFCREHGVTLVVMEATGGYERLPYGVLWSQGIACALANPRQVRRFAQSMGRLEKTDRIDAGVIARFGTVARLHPQPPPGETQARLEALTTRLRQITAARAATLNQRRLVAEPFVEASLARTLAHLEEEIATLEAAVAEMVEADPLWARLAREFRSIRGVGPRTVATLLAHLPEIGTLSNKAVAKLVGVAPLACDSGTRQGRRSVRGGRATVRSILVLVAGLVARHDPAFRPIHERLTRAGKPKLVIRVALARKLVLRLNAKARDLRTAFSLQIAAKPEHT
jgi:transposase